jgi:dehydrogenase/reductase SDR family member 7B
LAIPGFINTDITLSGLKGDGTLYGKSQPSLAQGMDPLVCSEKILQSLEKNREEFVIGGMEKYVIYFYRIFPGLAKKLMRANPVKKVRELKERFGKGK